MKIFLRFFLTLVLAGSVLFCSAYFFWYKPKFRTVALHAYENTLAKNSKAFEQLKERAASIKEMAANRGYNTKTCFLADMSRSSGKARFFVYDLENDSVLLEGLVAHGSCDNGFQVNPVFSNTPESGCSSLGKYKVGGPYRGQFGLAYKLFGLDSSNSHAYARNIVLHAYDCVPEQETEPLPICNSRGCAMIAPGFLERIKPVIDKAGKPILLWIFQ